MIAWLFEHILGSLPVWLWPVITVLSALVYFVTKFLSRLPQIKAIAYILVPSAAVAASTSIFLFGAASVSTVWQDRVKEMESRVALAEKQSDEKNNEIKTVYVDKVKVVHSVQVKVQQQIVHDAAKMDADCRLDPSVVKDLNEAAR